jgi:heterodisulfide reductase subunit C
VTKLTDDIQNQKLAALKETARPCFQCGICSSSCPVFRVAPELNPRISVDSIITKGVVPREGNEWLCAYCLMCDQRCPMGVSLAEILMEIKNISAREGKAPPDVIESAESLMGDGCLSPISGRSEKIRTELGLPYLPRADPTDVMKIFKATGAIEVIEANKETTQEATE